MAMIRVLQVKKLEAIKKRLASLDNQLTNSNGTQNLQILKDVIIDLMKVIDDYIDIDIEHLKSCTNEITSSLI